MSDALDTLDASLMPQTPLRAAITAATRRPEPECMPQLIAGARLSDEQAAEVRRLTLELVRRLRSQKRGGGIEGLIHEYALSSDEGVALMCLAEALLRIPDAATRDALIRDKLSAGDWRAHVGQSPSLFVNAATWGLVLTGKLVATTSEKGLATALARLIGRGGEPLIRVGVDMAMRMMGEQFVKGRTIEEALARSRAQQTSGFSFSYDMLGEAAMTADDAARYFRDYQGAIAAIGAAAGKAGPYAGPGISIKLSALHPRYCRAQKQRVMLELLPAIRKLALQAKAFDIGFNIDAEESERLELSLDLLEALSLDPDLAGWNGLGFVVQAYGRRCHLVIDWLIDLAARSKRRLMVRLVKGAYWDSEIKKAQVDGQSDFPVFTRKVHTDVAWFACARKLLAAPAQIYPQFATHNAQSLASVLVAAGPDWHEGRYEFQCLHGMGEALYEQVVGAGKLNRPCRIYAPVGSHETLLAYLVRRLLENGANSSFVNRLQDLTITEEQLAADPVALALAISPVGAPDPRIIPPLALFGAARQNARGSDLADENRIAEIHAVLARAAAAPGDAASSPTGRIIANPAFDGRVLGHVQDADGDEVARRVAAAARAAPAWAGLGTLARADILNRAARQLEARRDDFAQMIVAEAGRTLANALAEVREAVDFLRYYSAEAERWLVARPAPQGVIACISPWNFPLAIFVGQIAAALVVGQGVVAKPAEQTPLVAAAAVALLHEAGVPQDVLACVPGDGRTGAALVADPAVQGVIFTGSTPVARAIAAALGDRLDASGRPVPLIAETGGINAMIVDSSALTEQVVQDVLVSAFDSAGQRCSALRLLCVQNDAAAATLNMLKGAMAELRPGDPARLATDIGPVIDAEAKAGILAHIEAMRARGFRVTQAPVVLPPQGHFIAPTLIEINRSEDLTAEVFGPVLHVLRFRREALPGLIEELNAKNFGLTFGLHTRLDETIAEISGQVKAGNLYINRNMIGANVGVQPFGGSRLSGTGPKAGGPLYLARLMGGQASAALDGLAPGHAGPGLAAYRQWVAARGLAEALPEGAASSPLGREGVLAGPAGERNLYRLVPRGKIFVTAEDEPTLLRLVGLAFMTGNEVLVQPGAVFDGPDAGLAAPVEIMADPLAAPDLAGVLYAGSQAARQALARSLAQRPGPIIPLLGEDDAERLCLEQSICTNTAAAGGNAAFLALT
ncbi:MAG: bifunctional proline dehydrogenase/L-glutamate gamma-semialdehyde dehydrogenase PutA [Hyphomicrobiales bacterium]|nr:bifunctional proline dehydrogenase/L-glutamate gamma-semialdehyde dehydrogenase PutA [Hyphomicrobiales bacterium]